MPLLRALTGYGITDPVIAGSVTVTLLVGVGEEAQAVVRVRFFKGRETLTGTWASGQ